MADKKALEKRKFYKEKIVKIQSQLNDESEFKKLSSYELGEFLITLTTMHDKFELKCLAISYDADVIEKQALKEIEAENALIDNQCIKLKAKINKRIDQIKNGKEECAFEKENNAEKNQSVHEVKKRKIQNTWGVFNGKIDAFTQFYAKFTTAMKREHDLSDDEKFNLLLMACQGEAKNAIANLTYTEALKNLESVYGNVYRQMQCYVRNFLNINPVTNASASNLQIFYDQLCECEKGMNKYVQEMENGYFITFVAISKLDKDTTRVWERYRLSLAESWANMEEASNNIREAKNHLPSFEAFKAFLKSEINMLLGEESELCESTSNMELANFVSEIKNQVPPFLQCKLCKDIHPVYKCLVFKGMDLKSKQDFVAKNNFFVKCLRQSHVGNCRDASSNNECPKCPPNTFHNSVLCPENLANKNKQLPEKKSKQEPKLGQQ